MEPTGTSILIRTEAEEAAKQRSIVVREKIAELRRGGRAGTVSIWTNGQFSIDDGPKMTLGEFLSLPGD